jgi:exosortase D (VPLPA-CTERM-specific)
MNSSPISFSRTRSVVAIAVGAAVLMLVYLCRDIIISVASSWNTEEYSYAWFVPPIAIVLCLHTLALKRPFPASSWAGFAVILLGFIPYLIGVLSGIPNVPQYGMLIFIFGLVLVTFGGIVFKTIWVPLSYIFFALPLPQALYLSFSAQMQLLSSSLGTKLLHLLGVIAFQDGNIIDLGNYQLQVIEACNGLRYLFPLMGISFLFAYLLRDRMWKRLIVFVSAIPIAIGLNASRIALIGVTVNLWGSKMAEGVLHELEGFTAFAFCIAILLGEAAVLKRIGKPRGFLAFEELTLPHGPFLGSNVQITPPLLATLVVLLLMTGSSAAGWLSARPETPPAHRSLADFPRTIDQWHGHFTPLPQYMLDLLKLTDYLNMDYDKLHTQDTVNLNIVYYNSQRGERTFHSPLICIPGSGWEEVASDDVTLPITSTSHPLRVHRIIISKGLLQQLVYYWYEERGTNLTDITQVKAHIIIDSITKARTDGEMIRLVTPIGPREKDADADMRLQHFLAEATPSLRQFFPELSFTISTDLAK